MIFCECEHVINLILYFFFTFLQMFVLLVLVVSLHQTYVTVHSKHEQWPLRVFYMRCIEFAGRCAVFPAVILYYLEQIEGIDNITYKFMQASVISITIIVFFRETLGVRKAWKTSLLNLLSKINAPDVKISDLSIIEVTIFNYWVFKKFSTQMVYIAEYLHKNGEFDNPSKITLDLRNLYAFR